MKRMVAFAMCWCVFLPAMAVDELVTVTNVTRSLMLNYNLTNYTITAETVHQTEYPSDIGDPIFWFDCRRTDNWTFAADGSVAKIPSLVGERYLATDTEGGIYKIAWTSKNPLFVQNDESIGGPALDFGTKGSQRAMSFNKVGPEGTQTNMLEGIGSVIAVWYSAMGNSSYGGLDGLGKGDFGEGGYYGGALLGGGFGSDGASNDDKSQYVLYRNAANSRQYLTAGDVGRPRWYDNPFASSVFAHVTMRQSSVRHNGQPTNPTLVGFAGSWEVVSMVPSSPDAKLFNATGLGMNDSRISAVSGGFKVAEMLIFGKVLSVFETARIEAYLQHKWFECHEFGFNGNAMLSRVREFKLAAGRPIGFNVPVDVGEGEKLTIGELRGGRGFNNPSIVKSGAGKLEILDASRYGGEIRVVEGELELSSRKMPQTLPYDAYLHFDVSNEDSFITDDSGDFVMFKNIAERGGGV